MRVKCKSGVMGWRNKLRRNYASFDEFESVCQVYNLHIRLGYKTVKGCWRSNPTIEGSVKPGDFRRVR